MLQHSNDKVGGGGLGCSVTTLQSKKAENTSTLTLTNESDQCTFIKEEPTEEPVPFGGGGRGRSAPFKIVFRKNLIFVRKYLGFAKQ